MLCLIVHLPVSKINSPGGADTASGEYTELRSVAWAYVTSGGSRRGRTRRAPPPYFTQWFHRPGATPPPISQSFHKVLRKPIMDLINTFVSTLHKRLEGATAEVRQQEACLANHSASICRTLYIQRSVILLREHRLAKQKREAFSIRLVVKTEII